MRAGREPKFIYEDNKLIGVNLSSDFCAEHEWGIDKIRRSFGLDDNAIGVQSMKVRKTPPGVSLISGRDYTALIFSHSFKNAAEFEESYAYSELTPYDREKTLTAAWSENDFGIIAWRRGDSLQTSEQDALVRLYEEFSKKNILIGFSGAFGFENAGLVLLIEDALAKEVTDAIDDAALEKAILMKEFNDSGIANELKEAGRKYYALSPKRFVSFNGRELNEFTSYDFLMWLNPYDQKNNNFGWYTVEDLRLWIAGDGPVPKK